QRISSCSRSYRESFARNQYVRAGPADRSVSGAVSEPRPSGSGSVDACEFLQVDTRPVLLQRQARSLERSPSPVERNRVRVPHLLKTVGHQRGTIAATAIEHQTGRLVGMLRLDVPLDD